MSQRISFTKLPAPVAGRVSDVVGGALPMTFLACGIVNPMGPTMTVLASDGFGQFGRADKLYRVVLNPFSQTCELVGSVIAGESWNPAQDLSPFFGSGWGACPTLLIPPAMSSPEAAAGLFKAFLQAFPEGGRTWRSVKAHVGDPWSRVSSEVADTGRVLQRLREGATDQQTPQRMTEEEAEEMARVQLAPRNLAEELKAFLYAWNGAQEFAGIKGMSSEKLMGILTQFWMTCRIPGVPNLFDQDRAR